MGDYINLNYAGTFTNESIRTAWNNAAVQGVVNVTSAGNFNINANAEWHKAGPNSIVVAALENTGEQYRSASYSGYGSNVLVTAPGSGINTTEVGGGHSTNSGTSFSTPMVTGLIALMNEANSKLTVSDIKNILAYSSAGVGSIYESTPRTNEDFKWKYNSSTQSNGGGLYYSEDYGFGNVNAYNAVRMAEIWSLFTPTQGAAKTVTGSNTTVTAIKDAVSASVAGTTIIPIAVATGTILDNVQLSLSLTHQNFLDLKIYLQSPAGVRMMLHNGNAQGVAESSTSSTKALAGTLDTADKGFTYTFGIEGFRGVSSGGTWNLIIEDSITQGTAQTAANAFVKSVTFNGIGTNDNSNNVYHYTDEFFTTANQAGQTGRKVLNDTNGGVDWIDSAAVFHNTTINLASRTATIDKNNTPNDTSDDTAYFTIGASTAIENIVTGDGNDRLLGNELGNMLHGMRGNDILAGYAGNDNLYGGDGNDTIYGGMGDDFMAGGAGKDNLYGGGIWMANNGRELKYE